MFGNEKLRIKVCFLSGINSYELTRGSGNYEVMKLP